MSRHDATPADRAAHRRAVRARVLLQLRRARRSAVIVAVAAVLAVVCGAGLLSQLSGGSPLGNKTTVRVAVDSAKSVVPGKNEVRWAGIVVGRITKAELQGGRAVLTAKLDPELARPLHRDARLRLRPQTALNDMYLDVVSSGTPARGTLRAGEVLEARRTRTTVDVAEVLNAFSVSVRDRFQQALTELSVGLSDGGRQLRSAFVELVPFLHAGHRLGEVVARRERATRRLVRSVRLITDELGRRDRWITRLVDDAGATFGTLDERRAELDATLRELPPTLAAMQASFNRLRGTLGETRPALEALRPAARALPAGLSSLRSIFDRADPALTAVRPAIRTLTPLARDLAPTTRSLSSAFAELEPQLPRLDRITARVSACEREVQKFFAWTMSVFKFGNRSNLTSSPRGALISGPSEVANGADPNLVPVTSCADGRPTP